MEVREEELLMPYSKDCSQRSSSYRFVPMRSMGVSMAGKGIEERKWNRKEGGDGKLWLAAFFALLCLQVLLLIYFGSRKAGFHEDEYYSFYSTNRTAGLFEPDREWVERDVFRNEFVVLQGEGFHYGLVSTVQSWDVHPPLFYFILHTVCSFFPGVFSKWLGIGINIAAFCINFGLLSWLAYMVTGKNRILTFAVAAAHGFNAVTVSGVMFIRMYEWLTVFVLLCACLHVRAVIKKDTGMKTFLIPLMAVNYCGFLTQYYYLIFLVFTGLGFCIWELCRGRKWMGCIRYGVACGCSLLLAVFSYPASLSHIFRGYRGTGAASEFFNGANTGERLGFFAGLMNEYLFDGYLGFWLLLLVVLAVAGVARRGKMEKKESATESHIKTEPFFLLLFASGGYFFTVSKTALLLYETSNRYQLPVYGILLLLVMTSCCELWNRAFFAAAGENAGRRRKYREAGMAVLLLLFLLEDIHGLVSGKVFFLYEEEQADMEYARENEHTPVVVLYNDITPYHVWWRSQELMQYDRIYFASEGNLEKITDEIICGSDRLIVYAADYDTQEESLAMILECNPNVNGYRLVAQRGLWSVFEFNSGEQ